MQTTVKNTNNKYIKISNGVTYHIGGIPGVYKKPKQKTIFKGIQDQIKQHDHIIRNLFGM